MGRAGALAGLATALACAGCGYRAPADEPVLLRCPNAAPGDDVDHVMTRLLDPALVGFPHGDEPNPFVRYRALFHAYHVARALGWTDAGYVALVERHDQAVSDVDGRGFRVTPFARSSRLSDRLGFAAGGGVLVKDETRNVSGSHKARHLMGTLIELEVAEAVRRARAGEGGSGGEAALPPLAIASCGNAALAAAVVARAAGRTLDVFIPTQAEPAVVARLRSLGAHLTECRREPGVHGDPTYRRLRQALEQGAIPFTCQGNLNGLAIEGGETLAYELVTALVRAGGRLDRLFVQVGGGALASSCVQAFGEARRLGEPIEVPRIHAVQTGGAFPLERAYRRLADRLLAQPGPTSALRQGLARTPPLDPATRSELLRAAEASAAGQEELTYAARHRSQFMWPWEEEPRSVATGILDDETYDWLAVARGMIASGGYPVVVDETTLVEANELARSATGIDVDETGSAGLAGLLELVRRGAIRRDETVAVLFTGVRRGLDAWAATPPVADSATHASSGEQP